MAAIVIGSLLTYASIFLTIAVLTKLALRILAPTGEPKRLQVVALVILIVAILVAGCLGPVWFLGAHV